MRITLNPTQNCNTNFQAVSQKHLKSAKKCYDVYGNLMSEWYYSVRDDVFLWKELSKQDAIDTMLAAKKFVAKDNLDVFNIVLDSIQKL